MSAIAEVAVPYAMLVLHDDKVDITEDNVTKVLAAAGVTVEPIWIKVFIQAFAGQDLGKFITDISAGAAAPAPAVAAPAASSAAPAAAKEDKKAAKEESEEEEMGFGLFD